MHHRSVFVQSELQQNAELSALVAPTEDVDTLLIIVSVGIEWVRVALLKLSDHNVTSKSFLQEALEFAVAVLVFLPVPLELLQI